MCAIGAFILALFSVLNTIGNSFWDDSFFFSLELLILFLVHSTVIAPAYEFKLRKSESERANKKKMQNRVATPLFLYDLFKEHSRTKPIRVSILATFLFVRHLNNILCTGNDTNDGSNTAVMTA